MIVDLKPRRMKTRADGLGKTAGRLGSRPDDPPFHSSTISVRWCHVRRTSEVGSLPRRTSASGPRSGEESDVDRVCGVLVLAAARDPKNQSRGSGSCVSGSRSRRDGLLSGSRGTVESAEPRGRERAAAQTLCRRSGKSAENDLAAWSGVVDRRGRDGVASDQAAVRVVEGPGEYGPDSSGGAGLAEVDVAVAGRVRPGA